MQLYLLCIYVIQEYFFGSGTSEQPTNILVTCLWLEEGFCEIAEMTEKMKLFLKSTSLEA